MQYGFSVKFIKRCIIAVWLCAGTWTQAGEPDIFQWGKGLEEQMPNQPGNCDPASKTEFIPYHKGFHRDGEYMVFQIPENDPPTIYRYSGLGPFNLKPLHRYRLKCETARSPANMSTMFLVTFLKDQQPVMCRSVYNLSTSSESPSASIEQDFANLGDADTMILWIGVSGGRVPVPSGERVVFKNLGILDAGPLVSNNPEGLKLQGKNLLPVSDFENLPGGIYHPGPKVFVWGDAKQGPAEIVKQESQCLHIRKKGEGHRYAYFVTPSLPLDSCWIEQRFRVKGKGTILPGIWWRRPGQNWDYQNGDRVELTGQWQEVVYKQFCVSSSNSVVAAAVICLVSPEVDIYVDDFTFKILDVGPKKREMLQAGGACWNCPGTELP